LLVQVLDTGKGTNFN